MSMAQRKPVSRLSAKQLELVNVFLWHDLGYVANPATLRKDSHGRITMGWARETCERLANMGILKIEERRARKQARPTRHYRLRDTAAGFRALVTAYTGALSRMGGPRWPELSSPLFNSAYARDRLTSDFVRGVLVAKGVEVRYFVDTRDGNPQLADGLPRLGPLAFPDADEIASLCFPVSPPGASADDMKKRVHPFEGNEFPEPSLFDGIVHRHYDHLEDRLLVLPILGVIQVSPTALLEFLGDWKPFDPDYMGGSQGVEMVEHLVFRLVFDALGDLAITRNVPEGLDVTSAVVRPEHSSAQRHEPPLLQLSWRRREIIGFEAGFDTEHLYVGGEDSGPEDIVEATRNPENCWVRIWWDRYPPMHDDDGIEARIGYSFEDRSLLERALAHPSAPGSAGELRQFVKRTAWLGDAILETVITTELLKRLGPAEVRRLHELRAGLTSNAALARLAERIGLDPTIPAREGPGKNPVSAQGDRMLATHIEAVIGASFLDGGFGAAQRVVRRLLRDPLEEVAPMLGLHRVKQAEGDGAGNKKPAVG